MNHQQALETAGKADEQVVPTDYGRSDLIILWGRQPIYSVPVARPAKAFSAAKQRGATMIAIKPSVENAIFVLPSPAGNTGRLAWPPALAVRFPWR